ncbi:hypothetical protein ES705_08185 [subsurface metagenome]|jgi:hypothetical protein
MNRELDLEVRRMISEFCGEDNRIIEKKISEEGLNAIKEAIGDLNKYKEDFPDELLTAVKTLAKYASYGYGPGAVEKGGTRWPSMLDVMFGGLEKSEEKPSGGGKFPSLSKMIVRKRIGLGSAFEQNGEEFEDGE